MRRTLLLAAAATVCLSWSGVVLAAPSDHGAGAGPNHQSDRSDKGAPQAPAGQTRANAVQARGANARQGSRRSTATQHVVVQTPTRRAPVGVTHDMTANNRSTHVHVQPYVAANNRNAQPSRRFNIGVYHQPAGYVSRSWYTGQRLPGGYYGRGYWITDYVQYALYGPPPGFVWVRVGASALLVNEYNGQIVAVRNDVFY